MSECYLMHLDRPVCDTRPARHYLGFTSDTVKRENDYRQLKFAYHGRLMLAAVERGIDFVVARVWKNCTKRDEKLLRDLHNNPKLCPICNPALNLATRLTEAGHYQTYRLNELRKPRYGDLAQLRDRKPRPARKRVRSDGSLNYPIISICGPLDIEPIEPSAADREFLEAQRLMFDRITSALGMPIDVNYAQYGFDADLPY